MECKEQSAIVEMTCMEVRTLNVEYLDENLSLDRYIRVDAHLEHSATALRSMTGYAMWLLCSLPVSFSRYPLDWVSDFRIRLWDRAHRLNLG